MSRAEDGFLNYSIFSCGVYQLIYMYLLIMHENLETLKEIAIVIKALPKYYRTWAVLL